MARTATKRPAPKARLADPRNEALQRMTKAELVKTVKTLDKKQTTLLNRIAKLLADTKPRMPDSSEPVAANFADQDAVKSSFPWEQGK